MVEAVPIARIKSAEENERLTPCLMLTTVELADVLRCSHSTAKALVRAGVIPSVKIGGMRRIRMNAVEDYISQLPLAPIRQLEADLQKEGHQAQDKEQAADIAPEPMLKRPEVAELIGIGVTKLRELIKTGEIREVEISPRCKRIPVSEIKRYQKKLKHRAKQKAQQRREQVKQ